MRKFPLLELVFLGVLCSSVSLAADRKPSVSAAVQITLVNRNPSDEQAVIQFLTETEGIPNDRVGIIRESDLRALKAGTSSIQEAVLSQVRDTTRRKLEEVTNANPKSPLRTFYLSIVAHGGDGVAMTDGGELAYGKIFQTVLSEIEHYEKKSSSSPVLTVLVDACSSFSAQKALEAAVIARNSKEGKYSNGESKYTRKVRLLTTSDADGAPMQSIAQVLRWISRSKDEIERILGKPDRCFPDTQTLAVADFLRDSDTTGPKTWSTFEPIPLLRRNAIKKEQAFQLARLILFDHPQAIDPESDYPDDSISASALNALQRYGKEATEIYRQALHHPNPYARREAMFGMSRLLGEQAVPEIVEQAVHDPKNWVRTWALGELFKYKSFLAPHIEEIASQLGRRTKSDPDPGPAAARLLACLGESGRIALKRASTNSDSLVRQDATFYLDSRPECN